jgi:VWFA-related protein
MRSLQRHWGVRRAQVTAFFIWGLIFGPALWSPFLTTVGATALATLSTQFASGVNLVEVYATVTDAEGRPVRGLGASDFRVEEDGQPQSIAVFTAGRLPLAVAIAIDRSFSMPRDRLAATVVAARRFVVSLQPADQVMVIAIGSEAETLAPLSTDHEAALDALNRIDSWGTTPLYDASLRAVDSIQQATGRRALLLVSDGTDRYSRTSGTELVEHVRQRDVLVYPIGVGKARPPIFAELASASGGRSFLARNPGELQETFGTIDEELRFQYLLGYAPRPAAGSPEWRSIRVTVNRPRMRVRARDGYLAH